MDTTNWDWRRLFLLEVAVCAALALIGAAYWGAQHVAQPVFTYLYFPPISGGPITEDMIRRHDILTDCHIAQLKSWRVLHTAATDPAVRDLPIIREHGADAADWLGQAIMVDRPSGGPQVRIGLTADRSQAVAIVNAVADAFIHEVAEPYREDRVRERNELTAMAGRIATLLRAKRLEYFNLKKPSDRAAALRGEIGELAVVVNDLSSKLWWLNNELEEHIVDWTTPAK
jgi:hypothetical protein